MSEVPAASGSAYDRMLAGIEMSERSRTKALRRSERVRADTVTELTQRDIKAGRATSHTQVDAAATRNADNDSIVKANIANEQWGCRLATMYGIVHLTDELAELHDHMRAIRSELHSIALLLERLTRSE